MIRSVGYSLLAVCCIFLQGCMNVATSGMQAVYNRHSIEKNLSDQYISMQAYQKLYVDTKEFKDSNISIATYNGEVLLAGQVPVANQKTQAEAAIKQINDVQEVHNLISVASPSSTLTRMSDAWLTTKVKAKLIASGDVDATQIKVVTENGTVYLMGVLPPEQAEAAVDIASNTDGVASVVKIFSYLRITKT